MIHFIQIIGKSPLFTTDKLTYPGRNIIVELKKVIIMSKVMYNNRKLSSLL